MRRRSFAPARLSTLLLAVSLFAASTASAVDGTWFRHDPGPRFLPGFVADPAGHRMIMFGGWDGTGFLKANAYLQDTWQLDMSGDPKWTEWSTGMLPPRRIHAVFILDPTRNRIVMFGGKTSATDYNDLWTLDLATHTWSPLVANGTPPAPFATHGIYDPIRDRMVTFGGYRMGVGETNEVWELTLSGTPTWNPITPAGTPPSARYNLAVIYDPFGDRLLAFGGIREATNTTFNETWALSLAGTPTWSLLTPSGSPPSARQAAHAVYDPLRMRMIMFGGFSVGHSFLNDMYALSLSGAGSWSALTLAGPIPLERDFAAMNYDIDNDRLVLVGGNTPIVGTNTAEVLGDVWTVDMENLPTATEVSTAQPEAAPDRVLLRWQVSSPGQSYQVFRSEGSAVWELVGSARPEGGGMVAWDDRDVQAGHTYSYRLRFADGDAMRFGGDISVLVPREFQLAISAPSVVSTGSLAVEMTLPSRGAAKLEMFDVSGRRMFEQSETREAGRHVVDLGSSWAPGVYWVRVDRAGTTAQQKVAILR